MSNPKPSVKKCITKRTQRTVTAQTSAHATLESAALPDGWTNPYTKAVSSKMYYENIPWWKKVEYWIADAGWRGCARKCGKPHTFPCSECKEPNPADYGAGKWYDNGTIDVELNVSCVGTPGNDGLDGFANPIQGKVGKFGPIYPETKIDPEDCPYQGTSTADDVQDPTANDVFHTSTAETINKTSTASRTMPVSVVLSPMTWTSAQGYPSDGNISYSDPSPSTKSFKWNIEGQGSKVVETAGKGSFDEHYCE